MSTRNFNIEIRKHRRTIVRIDNFNYEENKITFLFGESGIGKSLIAKSIYGILEPSEFNIKINDEDYSKYRRSKYVKEIQGNSFFVFQEPSTHFNPLMKIENQLSENYLLVEPLTSKILNRLWDNTGTNLRKNILQIFPKPYRPSGGEKQRILLSMAFSKVEALQNSVSDHLTTFFVFDEPTGSLDNYFRDIFLEYLFDLFSRKKFTALLITHDYSMISVVQKFGENILNDITFKELVLRENKLIECDFLPNLYLDWLENQKKKVKFSEQIKHKNILLNVDSMVKVHNKKLFLSRDKEGRNVCPLEVKKGSIVYIKAPSGTGKTTYVKSIMGLFPVEQMKINLKNIVLTEETPKKYWQNHIWGKEMSITFQHADEALNQNSTVKETLSSLPVRKSISELTKYINELFDLGFNHLFFRKKIKYLSGGQKQKLNLLRSMLLNTDILILDEPLNGLDFNSIIKVLSLIEKKQNEGKGIIIISHNEEIFDSIVQKENIFYLHSI